MYLITKLPWMPEEALYILDKRLKVGTLSKLVKVCLLEKNEWKKTNIFFINWCSHANIIVFAFSTQNSGGKCEMRAETCIQHLPLFYAMHWGHCHGFGNWSPSYCKLVSKYCKLRYYPFCQNGASYYSIASCASCESGTINNCRSKCSILPPAWKIDDVNILNCCFTKQNSFYSKWSIEIGERQANYVFEFWAQVPGSWVVGWDQIWEFYKTM